LEDLLLKIFPGWDLSEKGIEVNGLDLFPKDQNGWINNFSKFYNHLNINKIKLF